MKPLQWTAGEVGHLSVASVTLIEVEFPSLQKSIKDILLLYIKISNTCKEVKALQRNQRLVKVY